MAHNRRPGPQISMLLRSQRGRTCAGGESVLSRKSLMLPLRQYRLSGQILLPFEDRGSSTRYPRTSEISQTASLKHSSQLSTPISDRSLMSLSSLVSRSLDELNQTPSSSGQLLVTPTATGRAQRASLRHAARTESESEIFGVSLVSSEFVQMSYRVSY